MSWTEQEATQIIVDNTGHTDLEGKQVEGGWVFENVAGEPVLIGTAPYVVADSGHVEKLGIGKSEESVLAELNKRTPALNLAAAKQVLLDAGLGIDITELLPIRRKGGWFFLRNIISPSNAAYEPFFVVADSGAHKVFRHLMTEVADSTLVELAA